MYNVGDIIDWGFDYKYTVKEDKYGIFIKTQFGKCRYRENIRDSYWYKAAGKKHLHRLIIEDFYNICSMETF